MPIIALLRIPIAYMFSLSIYVCLSVSLLSTHLLSVSVSLCLLTFVVFQFWCAATKELSGEGLSWERLIKWGGVNS